MKIDKMKVVILEFILFIVLFFVLFLSNIYTNIILATFLGIYAIIVKYMLKKRKLTSIYNKQLIVMMLGFSVIYLIVFYLMGFYFGFYKSVVHFGFTAIFYYIIPISIIIIASEFMRYVFISQKGKLSNVFAFISMVLIDLIIYTRVYDFGNYNDFLTIMGFVLFSSISCNLLYNYISNRFGYKSIIVYRMVTILYSYFIPIVPNVYLFFRTFLRMIYPYLIYLVLESTYSKSNFAVAYKDKRKSIIYTTILFAIMTVVIMLVSCKFHYGILVIGSGSMTGSIDKGDAILFESYDKDKTLKEGEVIIFNRDDLQIVHRIVDVKKVNGEYRYFTKGDANPREDDGYVLQEDIMGVSKFRIRYMGWPTIWLRDIFS